MLISKNGADMSVPLGQPLPVAAALVRARYIRPDFLTSIDDLPVMKPLEPHSISTYVRWMVTTMFIVLTSAHCRDYLSRTKRDREKSADRDRRAGDGRSNNDSQRKEVGPSVLPQSNTHMHSTYIKYGRLNRNGT